MISVPVSASRSYNVLIGSGLIDIAGAEIRKVTAAEKAAVISGVNSHKLFGQRLKKSLLSSGFKTAEITVPQGEKAKSIETYVNVLKSLSENKITRSDIIIALGGGAAGDLAGFAAATYMRGTAYVQIPTTLLAAVDSSIGGKTAIDISGYKNLAGCFWQPSLVVCDTGTFSTLSEDEFRFGCAEIIKYSLLGGPDFFAEIEKPNLRGRLEHVIKTCVEIKGKIVSADEFDNGGRHILNLGHTVGHAVEKCSGFNVPHSQAVAIGMAVMTRAAEKRALLEHEDAERIISVLKNYGLSAECAYTADNIYEAALSDKKRRGSLIRLVVPVGIGRCVIKELPVSELRDWLYDGGLL